MPEDPRLPFTIVFDLGGVLCGFDPARRDAAFAQASGLPSDEVHARLYGTGLIDRADRGELTREEEFRLGRDLLGLTCDYPEYRRLWCTAFQPDRAVLELVRRLRPRSRTAILTNNGPVLLDALEHDLAVVGRVVDHRFVSAQFGATKPSEAVYRGVERALGVPPDRLALVDDSPANVEGATRAGWRGIHFTAPDQLMADLAPWLLA